MVARSLPARLPEPMVADDLAEMPNDGLRYELIDGELFVNDAPAPRHQDAAFRFAVAILNASDDGTLGVIYMAPVDVRFGFNTQVQPDLVYVRRDRVDIITDKRIEGPPDLVVEVLSPSTKHLDTVRKANTYASHGVAEYWIVDARLNTIQAYRLMDGHYLPIPSEPDGTIRSLVLPTLAIEPEAFFARLR